MDYSLEALGQVIKELRDATGLTQEALGTGAGYQKGAGVAISRIESGLSRPGPDRHAGIERTLGLTPGQLNAKAATRTHELAAGRGEAPGSTPPRTPAKHFTDRSRRVLQEIDRRDARATAFVEAFNGAHDRARDDYFMPFVKIAAGVDGAPQPDPTSLHRDDGGAEASNRLRLTSYRINKVLATGADAAVAGAASGGPPAYGIFVAEAWKDVARELSDFAPAIAAAAAMRGRTRVLGPGPAVLLATVVLTWMTNKRSRENQRELAEELDRIEAQLSATRRGFDAFADILPRATETLDYIAVHAGHALRRWESRLGPRPLDWNSMSDEQKHRYEDFVEISACQLSLVVNINNAHELLESRDDNREKLIEDADEVLSHTRSTIESLV